MNWGLIPEDTCEKCNKKFEIADELIPDNGRLLQCGSCSYQWHYMPTSRIKLVNEIDSNESTKKIEKTHQKKKIKKNKTNYNINISNKEYTQKNQKKIGFLSYVLVIIISFIALIIISDTFKSFLGSFVPNIDFYLSSLYESLKDIFLFFKDLIK